MLLPPLTAAYLLLAASPIITVLALMLVWRWDGGAAGLVGLAVASIVAVLAFGAPASLLVVAWGKAIPLALFVLYVIWMALLLYHTVNEAGVIDTIGRELPGIAADRSGQALLLAWVFASFIQGATGFGVPAAVVAPLVMALGFGPIAAVAVGLLGHAWAVTFGSLGSSFLSLVAATGQPGDVLAGPSAALLGVACLLCGLAVLFIAGGWPAIRARGAFLLAMTLVMGGTQFVLAVVGLWTLAAFGAGLAGLLVAVLLLARGRRFNARPLLVAFSPYLALIVVVGLGTFVFASVLDRVMFAPTFPAVETSYGWATPAGPGRSISLFGHAGALLLYASAIIFAWFRLRGPFPIREGSAYSGRTILRKTVRSAARPTVAVYALVALGSTMEHSGMTQLLALGVSLAAGPLFPLISPFIGALGAFMTGSNTNSNVVFGPLQQSTAETLGLSTSLILAAQTAGGAIGSVFAPAKVVVAVSTVRGAKQPPVLRVVALWGTAIIAVLGLIVLIATMAGG
jgi:lactate permease